MAVPFVNFRAANQHLLEEYKEQLDKIFEAGHFILGPHVQRFEEQYAKYLGARHGIGVNSGTDAILISLKALGIGQGDEVICPAYACGPCAQAIAQLGATPVFVDVRPETYCLDPDLTLSNITSRTKAILAVHLFGQACEIDRLSTIARTYSVAVVEDMRHAAGGRFNGRRLGSFGFMSAHSFYPTRPLGGIGDGGMIATGDEKAAETIRKMRDQGNAGGQFEQDMIGVNSRLDAVQAAFLSLKLQDLDENNLERMENAGLYNQLLKDSPVQTPVFRDDLSHVYSHYTILASDREKLIEHLDAKSIGYGVYYPKPLHLQPTFQYLNYKEGAFPVSEDLARRAISLPICPGLSKHQIEEVASAVLSFYGVTA